MLVVFPWSSHSSPCVLVSVVQHTSTSTKFPNKTRRYVAGYWRVTEVIRGECFDNIPSQSLETAGDRSVQHTTNGVPEEVRGRGGRVFQQ